jgi:hypothetical protein
VVRTILIASVGLMALASAASADVKDDSAQYIGAGAGHFVSVRTGGDVLRDGMGAGRRVLVQAPFIFGADVGTDRHGHPVVVYSRCPTRDERTSCRLYTYSYATGRSERLPGVSAPGCSETRPRVDRGDVLFEREAPDRPGARCGRGVFLRRPGLPPRRVSTRIFDYDVSGGSIAYVFSKTLTSDGEGGGTGREELRVRRIGHSRSTLLTSALGAFGRTSSGDFLNSVHLDRGFAYWQRDRYGELGIGPDRQDILRRRITGGARQTLGRAGRLWVGAANEVYDALNGFAVDGSHLFYLFTADRIARVDTVPLPFR